MWPPNAPVYHNTRPRFYSGAISLKRLKETEDYWIDAWKRGKILGSAPTYKVK